MKDIILKIAGRTLSSIPAPEPGEEDDGIELVTEGKLLSKGNITFISYEETPLSGMPGCKTSLAITPGRVTLKRTGEAISGETLMQFETGKRREGVYVTPLGPIDVEILTQCISDFVCGSDGVYSMYIEYDLSLRGIINEHKIINIEIRYKNEQEENDKKECNG